MPDYYQVLGVDRTATQDEIKRAFRRLAREYHPDVRKDDPKAEERFKEINEAYQVLSDPERRAQYNRFGTVQPVPAEDVAGGAAGSTAMPPKPAPTCGTISSCRWKKRQPALRRRLRLIGWRPAPGVLGRAPSEDLRRSGVPPVAGAVRCSTHNARFLGRSHRSPPARVAAEPEQSCATPARNAAAAAGPRWRARSRSASRRESTAACACASPVRAKPGSAAVRGATSTCSSMSGRIPSSSGKGRTSFARSRSRSIRPPWETI